MHSVIIPKAGKDTDQNNNVSVKDDHFDASHGMAKKALDNDGNVITHRVWIINAIQRVVE